MDLSRIRTVLLFLSLCIVVAGFGALIVAIGYDDASQVSGVPWTRLTDTRLVQLALFSILFGSLVSLLFVLWKAKTLHRDWLRALAFAFKALGVLLVLLLVFWMASVWQKRHTAEQQARAKVAAEEQQARDTLAREERRIAEQNADLAAARAEEARRYRENTDRAMRFVREIHASNNPAARRDLVAVEAASLLDDDLTSLALAQAIHNVVLHDADAGVRAFALRQLLPAMSAPPPQESFSEAVVTYIDDWLRGPPGPVPPECYLRYLLLIASHVDNEGMKTRAEGLYDQLVSRGLNSVLASSPAATKDDAAQVLMALTSSESATRKNAAEKLEQIVPTAAEAANADSAGAEENLKQAIRALPSTITRRLPPRVYLRVANDSDAGKAAARLKDLKTREFIVPAASVRPNPPKVTTVRYYAPDGESDAKVIKEYLESAGIAPVVLDYSRPSEQEIRTSDDIASHFEVLFAAGAL